MGISHRSLRAAELASRFVSVHLRHLAIHEYRVEILISKSLQSFDSIRGDMNLRALALQQPRGQLLIYWVVFREKYPHTGERESDRSNVIRRNAGSADLREFRQCSHQYRGLRGLGDDAIDEAHIGVG